MANCYFAIYIAGHPCYILVIGWGCLMIFTALLFLGGASLAGGAVAFYDIKKRDALPRPNPDDANVDSEAWMKSIDKMEMTLHDEHAFWLHPNRWNGIDPRKDMVWDRDLKPIAPKKKTTSQSFNTVKHLCAGIVITETLDTVVNKRRTKTKTKTSPCGCSSTVYDMAYAGIDLAQCARCGAEWVPASRNIREIASDAPDSLRLPHRNAKTKRSAKSSSRYIY